MSDFLGSLVHKLPDPLARPIGQILAQLKFANESVSPYGRIPIGEPMEHAGVLWIIERDDPGPYARLSTEPAPATVRLMVNQPPICPVAGCGVALAERRDRLWWIWSCPRCSFRKRNRLPARLESIRIQRLLDRLSKDNL